MALAPVTYPNTYRASVGIRVLSTAFALVLLIGGLANLWNIVTTPSAFVSPAWKIFAVCVHLIGFGGVAFYLIVSVFHDRVVLTNERVIVYELLGGRKSLRYDEIAGRRRVRSRGFIGTSFIPDRPGLKAVRIDAQYATDEVYERWLASIPDLGATEARTTEEAIVSDPVFGATRDARLAALQAARKQVRIATLLLPGAFIVAFLLPSLAWFVVAVIGALPWLAILMIRRSPGLYRVYGPKDDAHVNIGPPLCVPGVLLAVVALESRPLLYWEQLMLPAAVIGGTLIVAARWADPSALRRYGSFLGAYALIYGVAAAPLLNARLDHSLAQVFRAKHLDAYDSGTRLKMAPWGPQTEVEVVGVSRAVFDAAGRGDSLCVNLYSGALGAPWYEVVRCK